MDRFSTPPSDAMDTQIATLRKTRILQPSGVRSGFLSRMFLVPKPDGSSRPILNLRRLNAFLKVRPFRLFSHFRVPSFLQRGDYLVELDLSQAYFHIFVKPSHQRFLSLTYRGTVYSMTCLPFGLASAPRTFASITNWVAAFLQRRGVRIVVYLDDFLLANQDPDELTSQVRDVLSILHFLGWQVNHEKSSLQPAPALVFLGISGDPHLDVKSLPLDKQRSILRLANQLLASGL